MTKIQEDLKSNKNSPLDFFKLTDKSIKNEEKLANNTTAEEDVKVFYDTTTEIREKLFQILELKRSKAEVEKIDYLKKEVCMLLLDLKKFNRIDKIRCKNLKDKVNESKQKVDVCHLQLQNLLYEAKFFQQEINKSLEFKSKAESIDLVSLDEFFEMAPKEVVENEEIKNDQHKCTIERLKFELSERIKLTKELKGKLADKRKIINDVENKRISLDNLKPIVTKIVESIKPVNKLLDIEEKVLENKK